MRDRFTIDRSDLIKIVSKPWLTPIKTFVLRYTLQATIHTIWWERNARRHGEKPKDPTGLIQFYRQKYKIEVTCSQRKGETF